MKKIPTLFEREFYNHEVISCVNKVTPGCEEALQEGVMTWKIDGACCAIMEGELYKRYDAKKGKTPPEGAIPCCEADPVTGHHPHWVKCDRDNPADKWFFAAMDNTKGELKDGTYEATGLHFNGNPYGMDKDILYQGAVTTMLVLAAYFVGEFMETGQWHIAASADGITMAFLTMSMCEIFHSFNMRSRRKSIFSLSKQNWWLWGSGIAAFILTTMVIEVPALARIFEFTTISGKEYGIALGLAVLIIPIVEIVKAFQRAFDKNKEAQRADSERRAKKRD